MKISKLLNLMMIAMLLFTLAACEKEGPAEKAGKKIDEAVEQAGEKVEETGEAIQEEVEDIGDKAKEAAE